MHLKYGRWQRRQRNVHRRADARRKEAAAMRRLRERTCRNSKCGEPVAQWEGGRITGLCPSCRAAGRWGVGLAFVFMAGWKLTMWWIG
jgi:hypothetical protein